MDVRVEPILYEQKSVFIQMLELYNYDFSEFSNDDINEYGYFGYEHNNLSNPHNIAEFFVMKKYRQKGVGRAAAMKIFNMFRGGWEISQWINNLPAQNFWGKVIAEYTNGKYDTFTATEENETGFTFDNSL